MPLSLAELAYEAIQFASKSPVTFFMANGTIAPPMATPSFDPHNQVLPTDEAIREIRGLLPSYIVLSSNSTRRLEVMNPFHLDS